MRIVLLLACVFVGVTASYPGEHAQDRQPRGARACMPMCVDCKEFCVEQPAGYVPPRP